MSKKNRKPRFKKPKGIDPMAYIVRQVRPEEAKAARRNHAVTLQLSMGDKLKVIYADGYTDDTDGLTAWFAGDVVLYGNEIIRRPSGADIKWPPVAGKLTIKPQASVLERDPLIFARVM